VRPGFAQWCRAAFQEQADNVLSVFIVGGWEAQGAQFAGNFRWDVASSHWGRLVSSRSDEFPAIGRPFWCVALHGGGVWTSCEGASMSRDGEGCLPP
jgi:hypothetical protein